MLANSKPQGNTLHHHHRHPQYLPSLPSPAQQQYHARHYQSSQQLQHLGSTSEPDHQQDPRLLYHSQSSVHSQSQGQDAIFASTSPHYSYVRSESKQGQPRHQLTPRQPSALPPQSNPNLCQARKFSPSPVQQAENEFPSSLAPVHARPPPPRRHINLSTSSLPSVASMVTSSTSSTSHLHNLVTSQSQETIRAEESMDVDEIMLDEEHRIEILNSESSSMAHCEPQRGWSSVSSQHTNSPSPIMGNTNTRAPSGSLTRKRLSLDSHHYQLYNNKMEEEQVRHKEDNGGNSAAGQVYAPPFVAARSYSEYRFDYSQEKQLDHTFESQPQKQQRLSSRSDPFPLRGVKGPMVTVEAATATPLLPSFSSRRQEISPSGTKASHLFSVPIGPNNTIQRDRKHHSWPLVAAPLPPTPQLPPPQSDRSLHAAPQFSPLSSPTCMGMTTMMVTTTAPRESLKSPSPTAFNRFFSKSSFLKRRQSSPSPLISRRQSSFSYMSDAQRTLYERHPPSPSPPLFPVDVTVESARTGTQGSTLASSPPLLTPKQEKDTNYVFGCAQTVTRQHSKLQQHYQDQRPRLQNNRRLPPIDKDGCIDLDHDDYDDDQEDRHQHPRSQRLKFFPPIVAPSSMSPPSRDLCCPTESLNSTNLSSFSSDASNHSFSAASSESSISPTHPPSVYPPPAPPARSSSFHGYGTQQLQQQNHHHQQQKQHKQQQQQQPYRRTQELPYPQQQRLIWRPSSHQDLQRQYQQQQQRQEFPQRSQTWEHNPSLPSKTQRFNTHLPVRQLNTPQPSRSDHHNPITDPSSSSSSSSALQIIKNDSDGSIMVYNPQTESMTFRCELCPYESFGRIHDLKRHQTSKHKEMTWPCDFCHRPFVRRDALLRHYTVKAARADGLHPASHEVEKLLEARARAKMLY